MDKNVLKYIYYRSNKGHFVCYLLDNYSARYFEQLCSHNSLCHLLLKGHFAHYFEEHL